MSSFKNLRLLSTGNLRKVLLGIVLIQIAFAVEEEKEKTEKNKPLGLIFISTAYLPTQKFKLPVAGEALFSYFIGTLWEKWENANNFFRKINYLTFLLDVKYALSWGKTWLPSVAFGGTTSVVLLGGEKGGEITKESPFDGRIYSVLSKEIFPNISLHLGGMYGRFNLVKKLALLIEGFEWEARLSDKYLYFYPFFGLSFRLFSRTIKVEFIYPCLRKEFQPISIFLINTSIERFLIFNFSCLKLQKSVTLLGYLGCRLSIFPFQKRKEVKGK